MIAIGFLAGIVHKDNMGLKWALFAWSSIVFFVLFFMVFKHVLGMPDAHPNKKVSLKLTTITFVTWCFYPIVFVLGDEFLGEVVRGRALDD